MLLLFFGLLEAFTRGKLVPMSKDLRRFKSYPARAAHLHAAPGLRVAFLGNSATERAIDPPVCSRALNRHSRVSLDVFTADASHLNLWQPMANHLFWAPRQAPDVLIVPFFNRSLEDDRELEIGRLAQFFTSPREAGRVMGELPNTTSKLDFAVSSAWATYALRSRLKERVLGLIVPDYRGFSAALQAATAPPEAAPAAPTYRHLARLSGDARARGCHLIFVALPWQGAPYSVAPDLAARVRGLGADWVDLHQAPGLKPNYFADAIHLTPQGRAWLLPQLARALMPILRNARRAGQ